MRGIVSAGVVSGAREGWLNLHVRRVNTARFAR
jgi:hypothetical protein